MVCENAVSFFCLLYVLSVVRRSDMDTAIEDDDFTVDEAGVLGPKPQHLHHAIQRLLDLIDVLALSVILCHACVPKERCVHSCLADDRLVLLLSQGVVELLVASSVE